MQSVFSHLRKPEAFAVTITETECGASVRSGLEAEYSACHSDQHQEALASRNHDRDEPGELLAYCCRPSVDCCSSGPKT